MASKRRLRRQSCGRKVRHETAQAGLDHIHHLHRSKGFQGPMDVYRCRFCGAFHVGHSARRSLSHR